MRGVHGCYAKEHASGHIAATIGALSGRVEQASVVGSLTPKGISNGYSSIATQQHDP